MSKLKACLLSCCVLACVVCTVVVLCWWIASPVETTCPSGSFRRAAVSADSQLCSDIGRDMLQQGGSAVDGTIAALLCTSLVNPQSMGIGGGSIVTIRDKTGSVKVYNFRETVPQSLKPNLLKDCPVKFTPSIGSQWIGVPGELRGYEAIHRKYGKLPWAKLFKPTITLAREGFPLPQYLENLLNIPLVKGIVESSSLCSLQVICNANKTVLSHGDTLKFSKLAETMETVAELGADAFYTGKIGKDLIEDIQAQGGTLTMEDLKSFKVQVQDAWTVPLGNTKMHIPPPPAGGAMLGFVLRLMKEFSLTPNYLKGEKKIQMYHLYIEALKFANREKRNIRDPDFNNKTSAEHLIDPSFINHIRKMISNRTHEKSHYYKVKPPPDQVGTTHVSVMDEDGLVVSATSTINQLFGGGVYSPQTGIILNNELADFCGRVDSDSVRAGEQPPSSMTPAILELASGGLLVIGGSGGTMILSAVASSLINHLWLGMSLEDAIAAPIVFVDMNNNANFEPGFDKTVRDGLMGLGHKVGTWEYFLNVVNALEKDKGCIVAVSDKRKLGGSSGY